MSGTGCTGRIEGFSTLGSLSLLPALFGEFRLIREIEAVGVLSNAPGATHLSPEPSARSFESTIAFARIVRRSALAVLGRSGSVCLYGRGCERGGIRPTPRLATADGDARADPAI